jgi:hypothetical protein
MLKSCKMLYPYILPKITKFHRPNEELHVLQITWDFGLSLLCILDAYQLRETKTFSLLQCQITPEFLFRVLNFEVLR